jgi:hypothetical protein
MLPGKGAGWAQPSFRLVEGGGNSQAESGKPDAGFEQPNIMDRTASHRKIFRLGVVEDDGRGRSLGVAGLLGGKAEEIGDSGAEAKSR